MKNIKKLFNNQSKIKLIAFVLVFASIGSYFVYKSFADVLPYRAEVTNCSIAGNAPPNADVEIWHSWGSDTSYSDTYTGSTKADKNGVFYYTENNDQYTRTTYVQIFYDGSKVEIGSGVYGGCSGDHAYAIECKIGGKVERSGQVTVSLSRVGSGTESTSFDIIGDEGGYLYEPYSKQKWGANSRYSATMTYHGRVIGSGTFGPCDALPKVDKDQPLIRP